MSPSILNDLKRLNNYGYRRTLIRSRQLANKQPQKVGLMNAQCRSEAGLHSYSLKTTAYYFHA